MIKSTFALIFLASILFITGCNNQRNNRLSAQNACDSSVRALDTTAYGLRDDEVESEAYEAVSPLDFPDEEALAVLSVVTTVEVALPSEEKAIIRVANTNARANPSGLSVQCIRNISLDTVLEKEITIPISNDGGKIQLRRFKLELGNPQLEDKSDFIKLTEVTDAEPKEAGSDDEKVDSAPVAFTTYFSEAEDEFQFFKLAVPEGVEVSEEDLLKQNFFIHYKNDAERVRSRMTVTRVLKEKDQ